jgi:hypothetical protein
LINEVRNLQANVDTYLARERRLRSATWAATLLPLAVFLALVSLAVRENNTLQDLRREKAKLEIEIAEKKLDLQKQELQLSFQRTALSSVREARPGPPPRVAYYRSSVSDQITQALGKQGLGFEVELRDYASNPAVKGMPVDTLEYGCAVSAEDIRNIALALTSKGGLPLRRVAPAVILRDTLLVQVIASKYTDHNLQPLTPEQIRQWTRPSKPCKPTPEG